MRDCDAKKEEKVWNDTSNDLHVFPPLDESISMVASINSLFWPSFVFSGGEGRLVFAFFLAQRGSPLHQQQHSGRNRSIISRSSKRRLGIYSCLPCCCPFEKPPFSSTRCLLEKRKKSLLLEVATAS